MANSDGTYEKWRKNAAQQWQDDRFTILWNELDEAYGHRFVGQYAGGVYDGMVRAYALITGDSVDSVHEQVARAAQELLPS